MTLLQHCLFTTYTWEQIFKCLFLIVNNSLQSQVLPHTQASLKMSDSHPMWHILQVLIEAASFVGKSQYEILTHCHIGFKHMFIACIFSLLFVT